VRVLHYHVITCITSENPHNYVIFSNMSSFTKRLHFEIEYIGLSRKEFAAKAGIKIRALDSYLGPQQSMPSADMATKIAAALGVSVEYLVTGREYKQTIDISRYIQFKEILDDLAVLPEEILEPIKAVIKSFAERERER